VLLALGGIYVMLVPDPGRPFRSEPPLVGRASAVDGDTLRLGSTRIRLVGLDAPELDQVCTDAAGATWTCGEAARSALGQIVAGGPVSCASQGYDQYGRVLARCRVAGTDAGARIVAQGLAIANGDYVSEERAAREGKLGMWRGTFATPRSWRDGVRGFDLWTWLRSWFG
jgi:endonuclease YncB( thermonuclease family)